MKTEIPVNMHYILTFLVSYAENNVPLAKQLLLIRTLFKKSQAELAREMKCDQGALSNIESGKRNLSLKHLERYCDQFGVQVVLMPKPLVPFVSMLLRAFYTREQSVVKNKKK